MRQGILWSLYGSLAAQWTGLAFNATALSTPLPPQDLILKTVLWIETIVQVIELAFYSWYAYHFHTVAEATFYRYHDWAVTTPLMLFSTMVYYEYKNTPEEEVTIESFLRKHWHEVLLVVGFNFIMLASGYAYERNVLDLVTSQTLGFAGFAGSFYILWDRFASKHPDNVWLFTAMSVVWGLYGVAAMFNSGWKTIGYNILDVISKNFYGVFLSLLILQKMRPTTPDAAPEEPHIR